MDIKVAESFRTFVNATAISCKGTNNVRDL